MRAIARSFQMTGRALRVFAVAAFRVAIIAPVSQKPENLMRNKITITLLALVLCASAFCFPSLPLTQREERRHAADPLK